MSQLKIYIGAGLVIACLVLIILWQSAETRASNWEKQSKSWQTVAANRKKQLDVMEKQDLEKVSDDKELKKSSDEIKDKIDEAAKKLTENERTVRGTTLVIDCARMRRSGQQGTPEYKRLCG